MPAALTSSIFSAYDCHFGGEWVIIQSMRFCYKDKDFSFENCWNSSEGLILKWWNPATTANVTFNCKSLEFVGVSNILSYERTRLLGCKGVFYLGEGKNILIGYLTLSHNMRRKVSSFSSSSFNIQYPFFCPNIIFRLRPGEGKW